MDGLPHYGVGTLAEHFPQLVLGDLGVVQRARKLDRAQVRLGPLLDRSRLLQLSFDHERRLLLKASGKLSILFPFLFFYRNA